MVSLPRSKALRQEFCGQQEETVGNVGDNLHMPYALSEVDNHYLSAYIMKCVEERSPSERQWVNPVYRRHGLRSEGDTHHSLYPLEEGKHRPSRR